MKIGLLTTSFPRREGDVPGLFVLGFARALVAQGHRVEVLAPEPREPGAPPHFAGIELSWVRYLAPRSLQRTFYGAGVLDNLRKAPWRAVGLAPFVVALGREARRRDWDAVVSHWALPCALVAGQLKVRRHLAVLHSADVFLLERLPLRGQLARQIAASADELLFSSRDLRARFLALLSPIKRGEVASRCHVCAMGIEPRGPAPDRAALRAALGLRGMTVLSLGRLIELKGIEHAIRAVAQLPEAELVVVGDGPDRARLERLARDSTARVRFVGAQYGHDKSRWLQAADLFVLPSIVLPSGRSEGMPTAVLEAMEHGLPVLASDVGGVRDVVQPGVNGLLVPAGDPAALAQALRTLRPAQRAELAEGARATAAMYHWSVLGPHLAELTLGTPKPSC